MARELKHHKGYYLADAAAIAFDAYEDKYGVFILNSARRSPEEQNGFIRRWDQGGTYNRPPYLYEPARPAESSNHVKNDGIAVDIGDWQRFQANMSEFGFYKPAAYDVVHFEHNGKTTTVVDGGKQDHINRQNFLNSRGWKLKVDGIPGTETRKAYREYQTFLRDNGYGYSGKIDGIWGTGTQAAHQNFWNQLNAPAPAAPAPAASVSVTSASFGRVDVVQKALKTKYPKYASNLKIDNIDGPATKAAVSEFQRRAGLKVDGIAGPATRKALGV